MKHTTIQHLGFSLWAALLLNIAACSTNPALLTPEQQESRREAEMVSPFPSTIPNLPIPNAHYVVRAHNTGAAFSFLNGAGGWQRWMFTGIGVAAALFILWMLRSHAAQKLFAFALACILGGAIGNVIDRLWHGYVVDFLDFHYASLHFPAFNVADSAITIGAACLILDELIRVRRGR